MAVNPVLPALTVDPLFQDSGFWITLLTSIVAVVAAVGSTAGWFNLDKSAVAGIDTAVAALVPVVIAVFVHGRMQLQAIVLKARASVQVYRSTGKPPS